MPVLAMFYGIIVKMYLYDNKHHHTPHFHVKYAEHEASIAIESGDIIIGSLPRKQLRLVQAWVELHQDELKANWELCTHGEHPYKMPNLQF